MQHYIFSSLSSILTIVVYIPYIRGIFSGKVQPHLFSWLIWSITQSIATYGIVIGGGGYAALGIGVSSGLIIFVAFLCIKYGYKNINTFDRAALFFVFVAMLLWWKSEEIVYAIYILAIVDFVGFLVTAIKSWFDPNSEDKNFWLIMGLATFLSILATEKINLLTILYLVTLYLSFFMIYAACIFSPNKLPSKL